jgi:hypothetical protein
VANPAPAPDAQYARFAFTPADTRGEWAIDDVYVDPYGKG